MRVLMFIPQFHPVVGGAERQAELLATALATGGATVVVLTPVLSTDAPAIERREGFVVERYALGDRSVSKRGSRPGAFNGLVVMLRTFREVWRRAPAFDIVHCHIGSIHSLAAAWAARLRGRPVICKAAIAAERSDIGEMSRTGRLGRMLVRALPGAFDRWVATTAAVEQALRRGGVAPERIVVIPNGVLSAAPECASSRAARRFLYLGRLSTNIDRDVPTLVAGFAEAVARQPTLGLELAIVGGGDLLEGARRDAAASGASNQILIPGPGDRDYWLGWADAFVLPSRREGLSNALLEAMAHGLACIANDIEPNREVLVDGAAGLLVPVGDRAALAAAILETAAGGPEVGARALRARQLIAERYAIGAVAHAYRALYQDLAGSVSMGEH